MYASVDNITARKSNIALMKIPGNECVMSFSSSKQRISDMKVGKGQRLP